MRCISLQISNPRGHPRSQRLKRDQVRILMRNFPRDNILKKASTLARHLSQAFFHCVIPLARLLTEIKMSGLPRRSTKNKLGRFWADTSASSPTYFSSLLREKHMLVHARSTDLFANSERSSVHFFRCLPMSQDHVTHLHWTRYLFYCTVCIHALCISGVPDLMIYSFHHFSPRSLGLFLSPAILISFTYTERKGPFSRCITQHSRSITSSHQFPIPLFEVPLPQQVCLWVPF